MSLAARSIFRARPRPPLVSLSTSFRPTSFRSYAVAAPAASDSHVRYGQPIHKTHPHLLKAGELTPGVTSSEYAQRRARLADALPSNSIAILAASDIKFRSGAAFFRFHQDRNFFYLTGYNEPDAVAVIAKSHGSNHEFYLFVRPKDEHREKWEGSRTGVEATKHIFGADEAGNIDNVILRLPSILDGSTNVFTDIPARARERSTFSKIVFGSTVSKAQRFGEILQNCNVKPLRPYLNELRAVKSSAEIANMKRVGDASGQAFVEVMKRPFMTESELEAFLEFQFRHLGCDGSAYVPVIASGESANIIHYVRNDDVLKQGNLVVVDAGGEYGGYITDITRAWPAGRKFSPAQKDLYEMILNVQKSCVDLCTEKSNVSLDKLHGIADTELREGLRQLGFDTSSDAMGRLFPHHLSHYVGLDVHDAPGYPRTNRLREGNCVTIEPGIYVDHDERWPSHFRGLGIRIEDSVCVQKDSPMVLTENAPKEISDIEALRAS